MVIFNSYVSLPEGRINVDIGGEPLICTTDRLSEECIMGPKILRHSDEIPFNQSYWNPRKIHSTPISMGFLQFQSYIHPIHLRIFPQFHLAGRSRSSWSYGFARAFRTCHQLWGSCAPASHQVRVSTVKIREGPTKKAWKFRETARKKQMSFLCFFLVVFFCWVLSNWKRETMGSPVLSKKHTMSFGVNDTCRFFHEHLGEMMWSQKVSRRLMLRPATMASLLVFSILFQAPWFEDRLQGKLNPLIVKFYIISAPPKIGFSKILLKQR